jgi:hypothetical protein
VARLRALRSRSTVRRWELRQLDRAGGVWYRVTRRLALSRRAWSIDDDDAALLLARGYQPDASGLALEPPRRLFVVPDTEIASLQSAQEMRVQASAELLGHPNVALEPFTAERGGS